VVRITTLGCLSMKRVSEGASAQRVMVGISPMAISPVSPPA
jgi:hypothetical protein